MYYKYKVTWYNQYNDENEVDEGLIYANSYGAAANAVVEDYTADAIVDIYLIGIFNEGDGLCINKEEIDSAFER